MSMRWQEPSENPVNSRLLQSLEQQTHQEQHNLATEHENLRTLLTKLAQRLQGQRLDDLRKLDTSAPASWSVQQWQLFWDAYDPTWQSALQELPANHPLLAALEKRNARLLLIVDTLQQKLEHQDELLEALRKQLMQARIADKQQRQQIISKKDAALPERYREWVIQIRNLPEVMPPQIFSKQLLNPPQRWQRKYRIMYLIAHSTWAARLELDYVLSLVDGVSPKGGALKRVLFDLVEHGFVEQAAVSFLIQEIPQTLILIRLTPKGILLCKQLGWEALPSEWDALQEEGCFTRAFERLKVQGIL